MKKCLLYCFIFVGLSIPVGAQTWQELYTKADEQWGNWKVCETLLEKALPLAQQQYNNSPKTDTSYSLTLSDLGTCKKYLEKFEEAEQAFVAARTIRKNNFGTQNLRYADVCNQLGLFYRDIGKYTLSEPLYLEAISIEEKLLPESAIPYAIVCNNLAALYDDLGSYSLVEPLYKKALDLYGQQAGKDNAEYAGIYNNLAFLYKNIGKYDLSEAIFKDVINIQEKVVGKNHAYYATACNNLGVLYFAMRQYDKAEPLFKETLLIRKQLYGSQHSEYANACNNVAKVCQYQRNYTKAESLFKAAQTIHEKTKGKQHPSYISTSDNLANLYQKINKIQEANLIYQEIMFLKLEELTRNFIFLPEYQRENYLKVNQLFFQNFYNFVYKYQYASDVAYATALATKGIILGSVQKTREHILTSRDTTLKAKYMTWQSINKKISKANETSENERRKKGLNKDSLQLLANQLEKDLCVLSQEFRNISQEAHISSKMVQKKLAKQEAGIEIVRVQSQTYKDSCFYMALVLTANNPTPEIINLPYDGMVLEKEFFNNYRRSIKNKVVDSLSYKAYWKPIAAYLAKNRIKKAYLSPDGVYNQININTLYNGKTQQYVLDEVEIVNVTNTKEILLKNTTENIKNAFLIGRPDYKAKTKLQNAERGETLSDLQGTETEVNNIEKTAQKTKLNTQKITAGAATKDTVLHQVSPSILHIATHGFFKPNTESSTQRMLQSGLIFAGSEVLTALEAMQMDLRETELVCLSACETGLGELTFGEGVYGLQRAFKVAGAKTIIMSLWKVNDEATQELMSTFYDYWLTKKCSKQTAFKQAQNTLRKKYKDAYYWGAFIMVGT